MSYRLVLELPFDVTLVVRDTFESIESATEKAVSLPGEFIPTLDTEINMDSVIVIPFKEKSCEQKKSKSMIMPESSPSNQEISSLS
jgi:hypothetical protein